MAPWAGAGSTGSCYTPAEHNLRAALSQTGHDAAVVVRIVTTENEAVAIGFAGSPTILIDGHDPFPGAPAGGLSCRLITTPDGPKGAPCVDQLVEALQS